MNGLVAILSGLLGNLLVDTFSLGPISPFDVAIFLAIGMAVILTSWTENHGDHSVNKDLLTQFKGAVILIASGGMSKKIKANDEIPEELIKAEILPRFPVKSLMRFKCVSRSWLALISSRSFVKKQLQLSSKNDTDRSNAVLVNGISAGTDFNINHCLAGSFLSRTSLDVNQFETRQEMGRRLTVIAGCYNGLCCLMVNSKYFILWNPATRISRRLPTILNELSYATIHGFGYDEPNDDYKVLAMMSTHVFRLYSLRTNSWKTVDDFLGRDTLEGQVIRGGKGALVNGKLHWISDDRLNIVSYNLGMEAAEVVELPSSCAGRAHQRMGAIKGCLSFSSDNKIDGTEVWVMKTYGVKESWCKVFTVPYLGSCLEQPRNYVHCISEDIVIIKDIDDGQALIIYYPKTQMVKRLRFRIYETFRADFCIQSLVSPFRHGEL